MTEILFIPQKNVLICSNVVLYRGEYRGEGKGWQEGKMEEREAMWTKIEFA